MKGQGIVEYVLVLILVAVVAIAFLALLAPTIGDIIEAFNDHHKNPCAWTDTEMECLDQKVQKCMQLEKYTQDQCVRLVGGGGS